MRTSSTWEVVIVSLRRREAKVAQLGEVAKQRKHPTGKQYRGEVTMVVSEVVERVEKRRDDMSSWGRRRCVVAIISSLPQGKTARPHGDVWLQLR